MKTLFLLRHAQAAPTGSKSDKERKLTPTGTNDALMLGRRMRQKNYHPDLVLCSTAQRTKETLNALEQSIEIVSTLYISTLYEGGKSEMFQTIQKTDDHVDALMIVAHNPSIHAMALMLAREDSPALDRLSLGYHPGTLSVFSCPCTSWAAIKPGENMLIDVLGPGD